MSTSFSPYSKASTLSGSCECFGSTQKVVNGRILQERVTKVYDPKQLLGLFQVSDFYLENLIATGAAASLKKSILTPSHLKDMDSMEDKMEQFTENNE